MLRKGVPCLFQGQGGSQGIWNVTKKRVEKYKMKSDSKLELTYRELLVILSILVELWVRWETVWRSAEERYNLT